MKGCLFHLGIYGSDKACSNGQCEALLLVPAAGGLEREHNIQSRGEWEGNAIVQLTKTVGVCNTVEGMWGNVAF